MRPPLAEKLDLRPHPEGGWYAEAWASPESVTLGGGRVRPTATLIHFLLTAGDHAAGVEIEEGQVAQAVVPAHVWQRTLPAQADALVSCLVSPGFDVADFELADSVAGDGDAGG